VGPFIVYRNNVQGELRLSDDQKQSLQERLPATLQETTRVFENLRNLQAKERKKVMQSFRQKTGEKLWAFLKQTLTAEQLKSSSSWNYSMKDRPPWWVAPRS